MERERKVYVIGHKNPDTDSICSAIAYAELKNKTEDGTFIPMRAGSLNAETEYVLKRFDVAKPDYMQDIGTQVRDMELHKTHGAPGDISIKKAYNLLKEEGAVTLPITDEENHLEGLITVSDIAKSYMNAYDNTVVAKAKTTYTNIAETLAGSILVSGEKEYFDSGKIIIGAANPDKMERYIEAGDMVVLGNRMEDHLCAIEAKAACIIIGLGSKVSTVIQKLASEQGCVVISTPYDTLTIAKLIDQSIPVRHLMKTKNIVSFRLDDLTDDIRGIMGKNRHRDFPVLDDQGIYQGTVSRRNLLNIKKKEVILVDHNEKSQAVDNIKEAVILEIIDHHRIGSLETRQPAIFRNQPVGCTATIIYQMYQEQQVEIPEKIAGILCAAILSDTLMFRSPTCTKLDMAVANQLAEIAGIEVGEFANDMFRAGSSLQDKTAEEIFNQDFKSFIIDDVTFGVGQFNSLLSEELDNIQEILLPVMKAQCGKNGIQMVFYMLTNILDESTRLLYAGEGAEQLVASAFAGAEQMKDSFLLENLVSRKKQLIPAFMKVIQEE